MAITYDDLVNQRVALKRKEIERRDFLHSKAEQLYDEYVNSLSAGSTTEPIASFGVSIDGRVKKENLRSIEITSDHVLDFYLITDLSASEIDKYEHGTHLKLWRDAGYLYVGVGSISHPFQIAKGEPNGCFSEVAACIKYQISKFLIQHEPK